MGDLGGPPNPRQAPLNKGMSMLSCLNEETHSMLASPSSPEHMSGDEDSSKDEEYTDSLTSPTTASG